MRVSGSTGAYVPALRPVGRLAITVAVLAAVMAVSMEAFTFSMWGILSLPAERVGGTCIAEPPPLSEALVVTMCVAVLTCVFAGLGAAFAVLLWSWRARANAEIVSAVPPRLSRFWSVGCWFVPTANLVLPPRVLVDIWAASCADGNPSDEHLRWMRLVRAWWAAQWTSVILVVLIVLVAEGVVGDGYFVDRLVAVLVSLLVVVGHGVAALFAAIVLKISAEQTRVTVLYRRLTSNGGRAG